VIVCTGDISLQRATLGHGDHLLLTFFHDRKQMSRSIYRYATGLAALILSASVGAQTPSRRSVDPSVGVLIVAHGADEGWNARVDSLAAAVRRNGLIRGPVGVSFLMGDGAAEHRFQTEVAALRARGAQRIVIVPALASSHSGHYDQIRYLAGHLDKDSLGQEMMHHLLMAGVERVTGVPITVTPALDDAPELAAVLAARAIRLEPSAAGRAASALFLFGHGPNSATDYALWMENLRRVSDRVKVATGFSSVAVELVRDDAPVPVRAEAVKRAREIIGLQQAATNRDVIVVPILISAGEVSERKLPGDLAGLPIVYSGDPLLLDTQLARWVERRVEEAVKQVP
jgi:sirohydrochlorin ferrochelatase